VGQSQRIIVLDPDHEKPRRKLIKLINPEIRGREGEVIWEEGCLSVVDFTAEVKRAAWVRVVGLDEQNKETSIEGEGLLAVALQHEIDHLDGILFLDHLSLIKRQMLLARWRRERKDETGYVKEVVAETARPE
jgi:peptide deformylase